MPRAFARYSPMVLREQRRLRKALPIVPPDWRSGRTGRFTFLRTFTDESIESSTRAIRQAQRRRALHARAFLILLAMSLHHPRSRRRVTRKIFPFLKGRRQIWSLWVLVFTTAKLEERVAPVATEPM